jgi:hypothetical protein
MDLWEYPRWPMWCHACGTFSWCDEWGNSAFQSDHDVCPVCGDVYPESFGWGHERTMTFSEIITACDQRREDWG